MPKDTSVKLIETFESRLLAAIREKYADSPPSHQSILVDHHLLVEIMNTSEFYHLFLKQGVYPQDRVSLLLEYLFDIKLELYFIEIDISSYNRLIYLPHQDETITENPRLHLIHLSFDQSLILKSRIAWERFTNFIYYLETGEILDNKKTNSKSKSKVFSEFVATSTKWKFIAEYLETIKLYDELLRTPEVHKASTIRRHFVEAKQLDSDIVLSITNIANNLWPSILAIIQGRQVIRGSWGIGMDKIKEQLHN
jgi:hypothetical protein